MQFLEKVTKYEKKNKMHYIFLQFPLPVQRKLILDIKEMLN